MASIASSSLVVFSIAAKANPLFSPCALAMLLAFLFFSNASFSFSNALFLSSLEVFSFAAIMASNCFIWLANLFLSSSEVAAACMAFSALPNCFWSSASSAALSAAMYSTWASFTNLLEFSFKV